MNYQFTIIIEKDDPKGWLAYVPALPGCNSYGDTKDEAKDNIIEAIEGYLEVFKMQKQKIKTKKVFIENLSVTA